MCLQAILTRSDGPSRTLSPSPPEQRSRPTSYIVSPGRQIIPAEAIHINKSLGEGEFGVVQQGVWTTERGEKVGNRSAYILLFHLRMHAYNV